TIEVLGQPPADDAGRLGRVGFVAQDTPVYSALSVADHLRLGAWLNPRWDDEMAQRRISQVDLNPKQRAGKLSGGQRAQLALTLAVAKRPEQHAILRPLPAELGGVAFASHYQSATTAALVGGDLYDITMTQFGPRFIIGDVKGKGLDAVGRCAAVLAIFRELAFGEADLAGLAEKMDAMLSRDMEIEDFVTVILAE